MSAADPYQPIIPGTTRQAPSARTFNGLLKAGQAYSRSKYGTLDTGAGGSPVDGSLTCLIQNKTGGDLGAFSVLVQSAAIINPATAPFEVQQLPTFEGRAVSVVTAPFIITQEPLKANAFGRAVVSGLALVDVNITDLTHTQAAPSVGVTSQLTSAASGGVPLWWTPGLTGVRKCLVLLGGGGSSGGPDATLTQRGWVSIDEQYFAGIKHFRDRLEVGIPDGSHAGAITLYGGATATPTDLPAKFYAGSALHGTGKPNGVILETWQLEMLGLVDYPTIRLGNAFTIKDGQTVNVTIGGATLEFTSGILTGVS